MSRILRGEMLQQFINEYFKGFEKDIVNIVIILNNKVSECVVNGHKHIKMDREVIKKYMYTER